MRARRPQSSARRTSSGTRLVGDPVLRIIEIDARGLRRQPFAASRIAREQLAEMHGADVPMVLFERLPGRLLGESSALADGHRDAPADPAIVTPHDGTVLARRSSARRVLPQAEAADERVGVVAQPAALRQLLQFLRVPSPEDHVVREDRLDHPRRPELDVLLPLLPAQSLQGRTPR